MMVNSGRGAQGAVSVEEGISQTAVLSAWPIINYFKEAPRDEQKLIMMLVHTQLHRILKKFKVESIVPAASILLDQLSPPPKIPTFAVGVAEDVSGGEVFARISNLVPQMDQCMSPLLNSDPIDGLLSISDELLNLLRTEVRYEGEDEVKEKQQGRALSERQKLFFTLIRAAKAIGLTSRRGMQVNSELLTNFGSTHGELESLIRWTVAARNVFLKRFASIKSQEKMHVQQQLSTDPRILAHLKGNVEYGLYWQVNALQSMQERIFGYSERFDELAQAFWILAENHEAIALLSQYLQSLIDVPQTEGRVDEMKTAHDLCNGFRLLMDTVSMRFS